MGRIWVLLAIACAGCPHRSANGPGGGGSEGFAISYPDAAGATTKIGKRFYARPAAQCFYDNGREAKWSMTGARVTAGELPPGLTIEDGVIGGVPKQAGSFEATIEFSEVTCAGKPYPGQAADVHITVK